MSDNLNFNLDIDTKELETMHDDYIERINEFMDLTQQELLSNLVPNTPKDHGRLHNSYQMKKPSNREKLERSIVSGVKYLFYLNDGTGIYGEKKQEITPKNGKYLVFNIGNQTVFAKKVKGIKPKHFIEESINDTNKKLDYFLRLAFSE